MIKPGTYKVRITQKNINDGETYSFHRCPAVLALARVFADCTIRVDLNRVSIAGRSIKSPQKLRDFVMQFDVHDDNDPALPTTIILVVPEVKHRASVSRNKNKAAKAVRGPRRKDRSE